MTVPIKTGVTADRYAMYKERMLHTAFLEVAQFLKIDTAKECRELPPSSAISSIDKLASAYKVRTRAVTLEGNWWCKDVGPLLGHLNDEGIPVALIPVSGGRYKMLNPKLGTSRILDDSLAGRLETKATMLYRPFSVGKQNLHSLVRFLAPAVKPDLKRILPLGLAVGLLGTLTPVMTGFLVQYTLPKADTVQHFTIVIALFVAALGALSFEFVKTIALLRIESRTDLHLQAAIFDRMLRLPVDFYRQYTAGDLTDRILGVQEIRQTITGILVNGALGFAISLLSVSLMIYLQWQLAILAIVLVLVSLAITIRFGLWQLQEAKLQSAYQGETDGFIIQLLTGLEKLRVAAAERRAYARWAHFFTRQKQHFVRAQHFTNLQETFQSVFPLIALGLLFVFAASLVNGGMAPFSEGSPLENTMTIGEFVAFITAFGHFLFAAATLAACITNSISIIPKYDRLLPVLQAKTEAVVGNKYVNSLRGNIEFKKVSFRYQAAAPLALNNLSFIVKPGEFVAIVGASGSGKSTILRLLLGFEKRLSGSILLDEASIDHLEKNSLRQQMGGVLQHGRLISGSIFTNIVGNSGLTLDDAWKAAKFAALDRDIEALPMGMHTIVTEGVKTLSGGQVQRLLIARALVREPKVLVMDEPTSALDNETQASVMNVLLTLDATRLIIAHRLSTIRRADRILVLERGCLVQQGTYNNLLMENGPFARLVRRQLV